MIDQLDVMEAVQKHRGNAVVVTVERASVAWPTISTKQERDVSPTVMGKGSSFALGVCLAAPDTKVIVFDGDGSLLMNLGSLATIAQNKPRNLLHIVLENGMYATTGGQPIPSKETVSFTGLAREAGYPSTYDFDDIEDFSGALQTILSEPGPVLVTIKIAPNPRLPGVREQERLVVRRSTAKAIKDLRKQLER